MTRRGYCAICGWSDAKLVAPFLCWWCYEEGWRPNGKT